MRVIDWGTGMTAVLKRLPFITEVIAVPARARPTPDESARAEAVVVRSGPRLSAAVVGAMPCLRVVVRPGSGCDNLDLEALHAAGVELVRIQADGGAVADLAVGLTIDCLRGISRHGQALARGRWTKHEGPAGREVGEEVIAVAGFGRVGQSVARRFAGWCRELLLVDRSPSVDTKRELTRQLGARFVSKEEALRRASVLLLSLPLTAATRHWLGTDELAIMEPGAVVINVARAEVVDLDALHAALAAGGVAAVGLDVHAAEAPPDHPLYEHPAVVATPHIGAQTAATRRRLDEAVTEALRAYALELTGAGR